MQQCSSTDVSIAKKKPSFISSERLDFYAVDNPSITVSTFTMRKLTSFSVDEILLLRYMNWFTDFKGLLFND